MACAQDGNHCGKVRYPPTGTQVVAQGREVLTLVEGKTEPGTRHPNSAIPQASSVRYAGQSMVSMADPMPMRPSVRMSARRPPRWIRPRKTPLVVSRSRWEHGSHNR